MSKDEPTIPDLTTEPRIAFVVLGGGTLKHWVAEHYLRNLGLPEFHLYDRDVPSYADAVARIEERGDGSHACRTSKLEIENYLHPDAINDAFGFTFAIEDASNVPKEFGVAWAQANGYSNPMGADKAKRRLADKVFPFMTTERILARDTDAEVRGWFKTIGALIEGNK